MERSEYHNVNTNSPRDKNDVFLSKPFVRQLFICGAVSSNNFAFGLSFGAPAVLIPQIREEANSTAAVSDDMASWISSAANISLIVWMVLVSVLAAVYGRRTSFIAVAAISLFGFILFYCSDTVLHILIAELMLGVGFGAMCTVSPMILTEYTSLENRGVFLTMKSASYFWGIWVANTTGTFTHWKNIGILGLLCSVFNMTALFWPESPDWLAMKGHFGASARSEDELNSIIASQDQALEDASGEIGKNNSLFRKTIIVLKDREFVKPLYLTVIMLLLFFFSGKSVCTMYSLVMLKKITNSTRAAYSGMLIIDGLTVLSAYVGCVLTKILKRRTFFLASYSMTIVFMLLISVQMYLIKFNVYSSNHVLSILLLSCYTVTVSCGPVILTGAIVSEIVPLKFKGLIYFTLALFSCLFLSAFMKISLSIFEALGVRGTFLLYALPTLLLLIFMYKHLPETKDKTLQEIEKCLRRD